MAKRLCLSSEDMTLVEAAVRDEYREMGIEETQAGAPTIREPQTGRPSSMPKPVMTISGITG